MITIAPSILSADFANLGRDVQRVREADWLHVDVMDGMFVSNISIGVPVVKSLRKFTDQFLDVHLMIEKPVRYVDAFADAGADLLTVHLEADMPPGIQAALAAHHRGGGRAALSGQGGPDFGDDSGARVRRPGVYGRSAAQDCRHPPLYSGT